MINQFTNLDSYFNLNQEDYIYADNVFASITHTNMNNQLFSLKSGCIEDKADRMESINNQPNETRVTKDTCTLMTPAKYEEDACFQIAYEDLTCGEPLLKDTEIVQPITFPAQDSSQEEQKESIVEPKESEIQKSRRISGDSPTAADRVDFKLRDSLRFLRRHFLQLYKQANRRIVQKRYVNCSTRQIVDSVRATLEQSFSLQSITEDLVLYTTGILNLKPCSRLNCSDQVSQEIRLFLEAVRKFSLKKFKRLMASSNLQTLCRHLVASCQDDKIDALRQALRMN
ncbi:unnamed protein product [Moneuplotes crassus]|uniref:Uncharacterized protein n=1 Tax=Euplotes crassus TaxID=5936 RepID=A0AAD1U8U7_EUPCR|nr:unnamed protein product [Moneuplotes crassus]